MEKTLKQEANNIFYKHFGNTIKDFLVIYTDYYGSKSENISVGAVCYFPQLNKKLMFKLSFYASIFSAEAWVIYSAHNYRASTYKDLNHLWTVLTITELQHTKISIIFESKSVLETLTETDRYSNYLIFRIKAELLQPVIVAFP